MTSSALVFRTGLVFMVAFVVSANASAEVLFRWDRDQVPSPQSLGISTIVVPAANVAAVREALDQGYRLLLEVESSRLAAFKPQHIRRLAGIIVSGKASDGQLLQLRKQLGPADVPILTTDEQGKWPHIRTNWVTKNKDVLQVTNRSAQPWVESNAALLRITRSPSRVRTLLTYPWKPITLADVDEGPALENYLVAIAESGSFGGDLLLPLHPRFQERLLAGDPQTRAHWDALRKHAAFFSWDLPDRYKPIANIGVVASEPMQSFEVFNLLLRHNLSFELIAPSAFPARNLDAFDLLLVLDGLKDGGLKAANDFATRGGTLVIAQPAATAPWRNETPVTKTEQRVSYPAGKGRIVELLAVIADPDAFALEIRQLLGADRRMIDIWNGITVLTTSFGSPDGKTVLVTAVNYAHQPLPVQMRVRGTYSVVQYESPEESATLLPYQHRGGYTEFVIPALKIGGRVFLRGTGD